MKNKNIIITGGAGFIGSNLVSRLNSLGYKNIYIVDNISDNDFHKKENIKDLHFIDYIDKIFFVNNLNKFKESHFCFHQGACTDTTNIDKDYLMQNNFEYSKKLLEFCSVNNINMVYASSASVYGNEKSNFIEKKEYENPINYYAESKLKFDNYVRSNIKKLNISVTGLRYFNVYGPKEFHKGPMSSVILKFYKQMINNNTIKIFEGSNQFIRDFIYIEDIIDLNIFFYENRINGIFNAGTGYPRSFYDLANCFQKLNSNVRIAEIKFPSELNNKYQTFTKSNNNSLEKIGLHKSFIDIEEGIKKYNLYLRNYYN